MASNDKRTKSKKTVKKTAHKAAPKAAKKAVRKTAARPARAKKAPPKKQESFPTGPPPQQEEYRSEDTALLQRQELKQRKTGGKTALMTIVTILIILVIIVIVLLQTPASRRWIGRYVSLPGISPSKTTAVEKTAAKPAPAEAVTKTEKAPEQKQENVEYYTVQVKDDLVTISEKLFGDFSKWREIYQANRDIIKDPTLIYPGQKLKIPVTLKNKK
jgi:hypothetical protein